MMNNTGISGVIVPMVTPLDHKLSIDIAAVVKILDAFMEAGVSPFILGTTGESVSISNGQKELLVRTVCAHARGHLTIYAGISGNCLSESVNNAKVYSDMGVDAVVAHLPFYYPVSGAQMLRYFEQMADHVNVPLILYNNPATVRESIPLEVIDKLSHHPNIAGIKDSERGISRLDRSLALWKDRDDFVHLLGWSARSVYGLSKGSAGIVPSTGNLTPQLYRDLYDAAIQGRLKEAGELQSITDRITEIYQKDRSLSEAIPALKVMMASMGLCSPFVLPPLYEMNSHEAEQVRNLFLAEIKDLQLKTG
jgi:4-hydroxy-tetrahydrodipicolinate synthase